MSSFDNDFLNGMNDGEKKLYKKLKKFESDTFKLMPNSIFKRYDKGTNQIDLIVINKKGIFVFEMKNYKGWIFGNENHIKWTQTLIAGNKKSKKYKFRNPVKQNENHIKTLRSIIKDSSFRDLPIINVVVFGDNALLKKITSSVEVVNLRNVESVLDKYRKIDINNYEISQIYNFLINKRCNYLNSEQDHINYINRIKTGKSINTTQSENKNKANNVLSNKYDEYVQNIDKYDKYITKRPNRTINKFHDKKDKFNARADDTKSKYNNFLNSPRPRKTKTSKKYLRKRNIRNNISIRIVALIVILIILAILSLLLRDAWIFFFLVGMLAISIKMKVTEGRKAIVFLLILYILSNPFSKYSEPEAGHEIALEDEKDEVEYVLGEPDRIKEDSDGVTWYYGNSYVKFNDEGLLSGWRSVSNGLRSGLKRNEEGAAHIDVGSTKDEVLKALGSPSRIDLNEQNTWYYGSSYVKFNDEGLLSGWRSVSNGLKSGLKRNEEGSAHIDIGSTKDEVLKALGSPSRVDSNKQNTWYYGSSYVKFDDESLLSGWRNVSNGLRSGLKRNEEGAAHIDIGSTKEKVLKALGSPSRVDSNTQNTWYYGSSYVNFNDEGLLSGWRSVSNGLRLGLKRNEEGETLIDVGSTKEEVLKVLGSPSRVNSNNQKRWYYRYSYIDFNYNWLVTGWRDSTNVFEGKIVE